MTLFGLGLVTDKDYDRFMYWQKNIAKQKVVQDDLWDNLEVGDRVVTQNWSKTHTVTGISCNKVAVQLAADDEEYGRWFQKGECIILDKVCREIPTPKIGRST